ncbi:hypothetical protein QM806_26370 [Rhodococcus sp. IEGM 1351]|uniref:hypothetical protein n=1 Tax=Rhodococcus sp. IEGM 1351 TaxID=3047089 RepID=UPI0024B7F169|nr:hypothetical protein [Rhodococcus sp. IEGM 1351]MDI9938916.1 hypothetical protein [Rhodococcus sp. IEGM 1351]
MIGSRWLPVAVSTAADPGRKPPWVQVAQGDVPEDRVVTAHTTMQYGHRAPIS